MPIYLITDKSAPQHRVMVEAVRPQTALQALIANRFDVSSALDAGDALRLSIKDGIEFIEAGGEEPEPQPEPALETPADGPAFAEGTVPAARPPARPPLDAFTDGEDEPDFSEVEEDEPLSQAEEAAENYAALR